MKERSRRSSPGSGETHRTHVRRAIDQPPGATLDSAVEHEGTSRLEAAIGRQAEERYEAALASLALGEREAIVTRGESGMSFAGVAEVLGKPSPDAARMAVRSGARSPPPSVGSGPDVEVAPRTTWGALRILARVSFSFNLATGDYPVNGDSIDSIRELMPTDAEPTSPQCDRRCRKRSSRSRSHALTDRQRRQDAREIQLDLPRLSSESTPAPRRAAVVVTFLTGVGWRATRSRPSEAALPFAFRDGTSASRTSRQQPPLDAAAPLRYRVLF